MRTHKTFKKVKKHETNKTRKNMIYLKSKTPINIENLSLEIASSLGQGPKQGIRDLNDTNNLSSYAPTINQFLVPLKTLPRENIASCNHKKAFLLKEPLKISLPTGECVQYNNALAKTALLKKLSANKHINPKIIIPPAQELGNCWFNTMFVSFFVSDKGRKFFHFFRSLMIEGKQANGKIIEPSGLRDAFALLNFAVEACLTGNEYAYKLDTNNIIKKIYSTIADIKQQYHYIVDIDVASNPIGYYMNIIHYLNNTSLQIAYLKNIIDWRKSTLEYVERTQHLPHLIILEIYDGPNETSGQSGIIKDKPLSFSVKGANYVLDSCVIRDTEQIHFCALITCEGKQYAYDGMSFHRFTPMTWKSKINKPIKWTFKGSTNDAGSLVKWSFKQGYQLLFYYRV
jgi:hypothetical protein